MGAEIVSITPVAETDLTKAYGRRPVAPRESIRQRAANLMVDQACRSISWSLGTAAKVMNRAIGAWGKTEPKQLEAGTPALEERGRSFMNALRENFGDPLDEGIMLRPKTPGKSVMMEAETYDTGIFHRTRATLAIIQGERLGQVAIETTEPTLGAGHLGATVEAGTSVMVGGVNFTDAEQTIQEVQAACDSGQFEKVYEAVPLEA